MKSPIISATRTYHTGFLIPEIMIAFSIMTMLITSAVVLSIASQALHREAQKEREYFENPETYTTDYSAEWGRDSCSPFLNISLSSTTQFSNGINLGPGNVSTDIEVRNRIIYLTADGGIASSPDFYIIDTNSPASSSIISSLNTGPGISALEVAGHYIYLANLSTTNQIQVIDISDRSKPTIISKFKLPLPEASTSPPLGTSIFYSKGKIYLGTTKWDGRELSIIDVGNPANPVYLGGFETGTQVNSIYVRNNFAYVAGSDVGQLRVLDISNPSAIVLTAMISPTGWETQEGKALSYFKGRLILGRTTGGFNVTKNHKVFTFSSSTPNYPAIQSSHDIPGGVYGIIDRSRILLATKSPGHELQLWNYNLDSEISEKSLGFQPVALACDDRILYFATGDTRGFSILNI